MMRAAANTAVVFKVTAEHTPEYFPGEGRPIRVRAVPAHEVAKNRFLLTIISGILGLPCRRKSQSWVKYSTARPPFIS